ncbi:MAG TPA: FkbM family methyltransferase [Terriglobales bacterium]|nr:FkbM family methyltransferase [Terriglobales bacterium]
MLESIIPRVLACVPPSLRRAIIGSPGNPHRLATLTHNLLNRLNASESQVFACQGPLEGYRMYIDWSRYRSFVYGTWEPNVSQVVADVVKKGMTVIDVGAHIGYYSLYFAKCVGPTGRVFCFEPVPENLALLRKNIQLNQISWIEALPNAVYSCIKDISFAVPSESENSGEGSLTLDRGGRQILVHAISLDSFCSSSDIRPDLIKLDVEGAELEALLGAKDIIDRCRPKLLIELHHFDGNVAGHPVPGLLTSSGYQIQWIEQWEWTSHILAIPQVPVTKKEWSERV